MGVVKAPLCNRPARRRPRCSLGAGVPTLRAAPARRCGLQPGGALWRTVWTGPAAGGTDCKGDSTRIAKGILHAQRDERHLRGAHVANEPTHNGAGLGNPIEPCLVSTGRGNRRRVGSALQMAENLADHLDLGDGGDNAQHSDRRASLEGPRTCRGQLLEDGIHLRHDMGPRTCRGQLPGLSFINGGYSTNRLTICPARLILNYMVELQTPQLDAIFHALGDATRRRMLRELAHGERTVGQLAAPFAISLAAASKHIKVLENAGLIRREVRGRTHLCRLAPAPLASA